jgi:hypothetical protein
MGWPDNSMHFPRISFDLPVDVTEVLARDLDTLLHGLLTLTNPNTRVVAEINGKTISIQDIPFPKTSAIKITTTTTHYFLLGLS